MKIFLSHSVKDDPESEAIARELFAALAAGNFEPFLDLERLEIGEDWEATLKQEIERSDAAILLLSKKAIQQSEWVAREIHLLQVREGNRPGFLILPLLLGDARVTDISAGRLAHLDLASRQSLRVAGNPDWLDHVLKQLEGARTGVLEEYLGALKTQCERLPLGVLAATGLVPRISEIYVRNFVEEQSADGGVKGPASGERRQPRPSRGKLDLERLLQERDNAVLEGGPGTGKTTFLAHLALAAIDTWQDGRQHEYVPVLVSARTFVQQKGSFSTSLQDEIERSLGWLLLRPLPPAFFDRAPRPHARWLVLLDALDEVLDKSELSSLITDLLGIAMRAEVPYRFMVTTRPIGATPHFAKCGYGVHHMLPFTSRQIEDFANKWFVGRSGDVQGFLGQIAASRLADLVSRPLLLTIAAIVYEKSAIALGSRAALYREFVAAVLDREELVRDSQVEIRAQWQKARGQQGLESADKVFNGRRELLHQLARYLREGGREQLAAEALRFGRQRRWIPPNEDPAALSRMEGLLGRTGLIAGLGDRQAFLHPTFVDYLFATELDAGSPANQDRIEELLNRWKEGSNREVVLFLLGIWSERKVDVDERLRKIFRSGPEGVRFCGLAMAEEISLAPNLEAEVIERLLDQTRKFGLVEIHEHPNATDVLGMLKGREPVRTGLLQIARGDEMYEGVRDRTADALASLGCVEDLRDLSLDLRVSAKTRMKAAAHLGMHDAEAARSTLVGLTVDKQTDGYVRIDAVAALWRLGFARDASGLALGLCLDPEFCSNEHLRVRVAEILGGNGRPEEALEFLFRSLHDPDVWMSPGLVHDDLVPAIFELGAMEQLLEVRSETAWSRRIALTLVRLLYRHEEDEAGARLLSEILRDSRELGERRLYPTDIFKYVQDQRSLARIVRDPSVDEDFRRAAADYLKSIKYREGEDRRVDLFPRLPLIQGRRAGPLLEAWWKIERAWATLAGLAGRSMFALRAAVGPLIRWTGSDRYVRHLSHIACSHRASEDQRLRALDRLNELEDDEESVKCMRIVAADLAIAPEVRALCAYFLFTIDPTGEDWQLIAGPGATKWGAESYFEELGKSENPEASILLVKRVIESDDVDSEFQVYAIRSIGAWPDSALAEELARNPSLKPWARVLAVRQIPITRVELLSSLAYDEGVNPWCRIEAVDRLGRFERANELLSVAEETAIDDRIRRYAIWWLGCLDDGALERRLRDLQEKTLSPCLRTAVDDASALMAARASLSRPAETA